ncbi:MAG: hypothetical protein ACI8PT_000740 [Gammaproteobacteria bacterium]
MDVFARRMQSQEMLTVQIARAIGEALAPRGVGVIIEAAHQCMTTRGVRKPGVALVTRSLVGALRTDPVLRNDVLARARPGAVRQACVESAKRAPSSHKGKNGTHLIPRQPIADSTPLA